MGVLVAGDRAGPRPGTCGTLYISGERHEGGSDAQVAYVAGGMFEYLIAPRLLKLVVVSVTAY